MEMNQIRYFLAVCEYQNFTHAAGASNVSQPSLTTSIKKLEEELDGALFIRDRAGCRLTPLGKLMYPRLHKMSTEARGAPIFNSVINELVSSHTLSATGEIILQYSEYANRFCSFFLKFLFATQKKWPLANY